MKFLSSRSGPSIIAANADREIVRLSGIQGPGKEHHGRGSTFQATFLIFHFDHYQSALVLLFCPPNASKLSSLSGPMSTSEGSKGSSYKMLEPSQPRVNSCGTCTDCGLIHRANRDQFIALQEGHEVILHQTASAKGQKTLQHVHKLQREFSTIDWPTVYAANI